MTCKCLNLPAVNILIKDNMNRLLHYIFFVVAIFSFSTIQGQRLSVTAPQHASAGEAFRLEYTVNTSTSSDELRLGRLPDGMEIVFGPSISRQESFTMVNGHTSSSSTTTYTYMVECNRSGVFVLPSASIVIGGKRISSQQVKINVGAGKRTRHSSYNRDEGTRSVNDKDLFVRVTASKKRVYEQEPVLLTYKVYTLVDLTQLEGKMPELNGFHTQEIALPQQKTYGTERVGDRNYKTVTWSQYLMFPQTSGKLNIPSLTFHGIVMKEKENIDPYEAFLNGGRSFVETKRDIRASGLTLTVDPLPAKPDDFSGGVGRFNISASTDKVKAKTGDAIRLRVVISGEGNLKLIGEPNLDFPDGVEHYDAKVTDKTKVTPRGMSGQMLFDYIIVPQKEGKLTIPAARFIYFDISTHKYKTITTSPISIEIEKGNNVGNAFGKGNLSNDIADIKTGNSELLKRGDGFFLSPLFWISLLLPIIIFAFGVVVLKRYINERADIANLRMSNADKSARKRMATAKSLMDKGIMSGFYDEVLHALWGYAADKLSIEKVNLSADDVNKKMLEYGIPEEKIQDFIRMIDQCEMARYAPDGDNASLKVVYDDAIAAIAGIEDSMSGKGKRHSKHLFMLILLMVIPVMMSAQTKDLADKDYREGNYKEAVSKYEQLLQKGNSFEIYYNLGNAYYRLDSLGKSILNYERALLLNPSDQDVISNLEFVRAKTTDRIVPKSRMFFVTWFEQLISSFSADGWSYVTIVFLLISLMFLGVYLFSRVYNKRKLCFSASLLFFIFMLTSLYFASLQYKKLVNSDAAIVMKNNTAVKKRPSLDSESNIVLHEGTKVKLKDTNIDGWAEIEMADGRKGWLRETNIEVI